MGLSGRNRTATALLGSASASSEPLHDVGQDAKGGLHKNSNASHSRKDHFQLLSQEPEAPSKHLLIAQNVLDRKKRLKTSQGTKSGGLTHQTAAASKLPLM